jgi:hypothetical protein
MLSRRAFTQALPCLALPAGAAGHTTQPQGIAWSPPTDLARGNGVRGPWRQNESRYDFVDDPAVAIAPDGSLVVAWVDQARKRVRVQRIQADGHAVGAAAELSGQPGTFSWLPRLALVPDAPATVLALWQQIIFSGGSHGGEMMLARSQDGGRSFSAPINLSDSRGGDGKGRITPEYWHNGSYDLLALPGGAVAAAWTEYDGPLWFARSTDGGSSFSRPLRVAGGPGERPVRAPSLASVGGEVLLAWTLGDEPAADIHVARSGGDGFERPLVLRATGYSDAPRLAVDGQGTVHLAWGEAEAGPFTAQRILHARSRDGGRSFEAPRAAASPPQGYASAGFPSLGVTARGALVLLAELQEDLRGRPRALGIAVSRDGGASFEPMRVVPHSRDPGGGSNGSSQGLLIPKLAVHPGGDLAVVNSALREGSHSRVWLVRGRLPA